MKNKFGELFSIKQPFDIKTTEDTSDESLTQKILVVMRDNIDNAIVGEIVKTATAEGVTDLAILNKAEIIKALEKQIPKKPIINKRKIQCVNGHNQPVQHYKYCPMCGQLIEWSDEE